MKKELLKKTMLALMVLCASAASAVAQNAQLLSFGFYQADNAALSSDYVATLPAYSATATSYDVEIGLPAGTDLTALVARFTVNEGNTVTVDGVAQTSGVTKNDFTDPVDYMVRGANNVRYTITVTELSAVSSSWSEVAVYDGTEVYSDACMKVNPKDGMPYIAFKIRKDDNYKMSVLKYDGTSWQQVGQEAFSGEVNGSHYAFDIAPDGTPYVAFGDQDATSLKGALSVMKFDGTQWQYVGEQGLFSVQAQYVGIAALQNALAVVLQNNSKSADIPQRALGVATYDGTQWTTGESALLPSGQAMYTAKVGSNGQIATAISINRGKIDDVNYGHNIFKYENGQWEALLTNFLEPGATQTSIAIGSFGTTVAPDGTIYAWTGDDVPQTKVYQVRLKRYDAAAKTWNTVTGNTLPIGHDNGFESHISLDIAIAPNGMPFVAYNNYKAQKKLYAMNLDANTNQWTPSVQLAEDAADVNISFAADGTGYITYTDGANHIHLLKYADSAAVGITAAGAAAKTAEEYYDLQGHRVATPQKGLYIKRATDAAGKVTVQKVLR